MSEFAGKEQVRVKQPVIARTIIDDVKEWWNGPQPTARLVKPEVAVTKQDFNQSIALVMQPLALAQNEISGHPSRLKFASAAAKLGPAAEALKVMAAHKQEASNQAALLSPVADIESAHTTLQVFGDYLNAPQIWIGAFNQALAAVESALAAPVIDPDAARDAKDADPPPANGVLKRDHDLIEVSVKPTLQRLIATTSAEPNTTWRPDECTEPGEALTALGAVNVKQLAAAEAAVEKGKQAIKVYAGNLDKSLADCKAKLDSAQAKLAAAVASYYESDPRDPASPSYNPDLPPEEPPK